MRRPEVRHAFKLRTDSEALERLAPELKEFGLRQQLPSATIFAVNLALEEVVTNIISYGYDTPGAHVIAVELDVADGIVTTTIEDDGRPFDLSEAAEPDVSAPLEERSVGGLGLLLIRRLMDDVTYERRNGRNRLTLKKQISSGESPAGE
jgi:anti-sigma regulatory factor (Ser/Thr protein kinase)